jgi:hypothetical protein
MLENDHNDRPELATQRLVNTHWETIRLLDGVDVAGLSAEGRAVLRLVVADMRPRVDLLAGGLSHGEWSDEVAPGVRRSIEALQARLEEIRLATAGK